MSKFAQFGKNRKNYPKITAFFGKYGVPLKKGDLIVKFRCLALFYLDIVAYQANIRSACFS